MQKINSYLTTKLVLILLCTSTLFSACTKRKPQSPLNVEIIGTWVDDDNSCNAIFTKQGDQLILSSFTSKDFFTDNVALTSYKESIFSKFKSNDPNIKFSGMFTEGFILIDNKYCSSKLHKIDGYTPKKTSSGYQY